MKSIINKITSLKESSIADIIKGRVESFKQVNKNSEEDVFSELCFCILTANFSAKGGIKIQNALKNRFLNISEDELKLELKKLGHRFPNARAKYIVLAREKLSMLMKVLREEDDENKIREWIVKNIKGIGYKEASHFLRNIGFENLAIIDFHIIDLLVREGIVEKPKTMTRKAYLKIEDELRKISQQTQIPLGELDLYLWYIETGTVMK